MNRKKKIAAFAMIVCLVMALLAFWLRGKLSFQVTAGPMLQMVSTTGFTVVWKTDSVSPGRLRVTHEGKQVADAAAVLKNGLFLATVTGLQPGQSYAYSIHHTLAVREMSAGTTWSCRTDAGPQGPFRFLAFGDSGSGNRSQYLLAERMTRCQPDLIIHTGDLIYPEGSIEDYRAKFFQPYVGLIPSAAFMPAMGNHDYMTHRGQPLLDTFVLPHNGPAGTDPARHYWFDYGCARFVTLDSDVEESELRGQVAPWIRQVFASAGPKWRLVFFHHPPYTGAAKHPPDKRVQQFIVPVLEETMVDIVFNGHNHLYERSRPILAGDIVGGAEGILYIVTGAGGASRYTMKGPELRPAYVEAFFDSDFSFTLVDVSPSSLKLQQINLHGRTVDSLGLNRGPRSSSSRQPVAQ
jgi:hypothetical protein